MKFGFLLFENITQLDMTGPYEVFSDVPGAELFVIAKTLSPVRADSGLCIMPSVTYDEVDALDLLLVPGGGGTSALLNDPETLAFITRIARTATYITSVCTGALVLGAAGLLVGRKAATHWYAREFLAAFGAISTPGRWVIDLPYITGGGVTAGIDFALATVAEIYGPQLAKRIQLTLEYDPAPPFDSGDPDRAEPSVRAEHVQLARPMYAARAQAVDLARARLRATGVL